MEEMKDSDGKILVTDNILRVDLPTIKIYNSEYSFDGKPVYDEISTGPSDNVMTPEEFASKMKEIASNRDDIELCHKLADNLMMELLSSLGYSEGVNVFDQMDKYYS